VQSSSQSIRKEPVAERHFALTLRCDRLERRLLHR
jgi:hypothetical protein